MSLLLNDHANSEPAWYTYTDLAGQTYTYNPQSADSAAEDYKESHDNE